MKSFYLWDKISLALVKVHASGFPLLFIGKVSTCRGWGIHSWVGKIPWRRKWQPLQYPCHGQRSLEGYSPWGHKRVRHDVACRKQQLQVSVPTEKVLRCLLKPINLQLALKFNAFYRDRGNQVEQTSQLPASLFPWFILLTAFILCSVPTSRCPCPGCDHFGPSCATFGQILILIFPSPSEMMFRLSHCPGWNTSFMLSNPQAHL